MPLVKVEVEAPVTVRLAVEKEVVVALVPVAFPKKRLVKEDERAVSEFAKKLVVVAFVVVLFVKFAPIAVTVPVAKMSPATESLAKGEVVPMPTLPKVGARLIEPVA